VDVSGLGYIVNVGNVSGGWHSLAVKPDGTVWAWGDNTFGQLGNGTTTGSNVPIHVSGLTNVVSVAGGASHSIALKADGTVWAWGLNLYGALGNGTFDNSTTPVQVSGLTGVIKIAAGTGHNLAITSDGTVWTWGEGIYGQLGTGQTWDSLLPVHVPGLSGVVSVAGGYGHSMALKSDGTVYDWGINTWGNLGNGTNVNSTYPVQVSGLSNVAGIGAGYLFSVALKSDGTVWSWGDNSTGQLGTEMLINSSNVPIRVLVITNVTKLVAGGYHSVAVQSDGSVFVWGQNVVGQAGNGTVTPMNNLPVRSNLNNPLLLSAGMGHTLAIMPPPAPVPFASVSPKLTITGGRNPGFDLTETFTLGASSNGMNPTAEYVTLQIGTYGVVFPLGSFQSNANGKSAFSGVLNGVNLSVTIQPAGGNSYSFKASGDGVNLSTLINPIPVIVAIGNDSGSATVFATFR
jgi:hypothetical protein